MPDAQLWIVGSGDNAARLEQARDAGVYDAIRFLGRVPDAELGALYRRAALFAMPSRQEGFGWCMPRRCGGDSRASAPRPTPRARSSSTARPACSYRTTTRTRWRAREVFTYARFRADLMAALEAG